MDINDDNLKHLLLFTIILVIIGTIAYFVLSHDAIGFEEASLFWSILFLVAGAILIYTGGITKRKNIKKFCRIGYVFLVLGYAFFATELIIFIVSFAISEPFDLDDYLQALLISVTGLIGAATIYFATISIQKSENDKIEDAKIEKNREDIEAIHEDYLKRITELEKEIEELRKK